MSIFRGVDTCSTCSTGSTCSVIRGLGLYLYRKSPTQIQHTANTANTDQRKIVDLENTETLNTHQLRRFLILIFTNLWEIYQQSATSHCKSGYHSNFTQNMIWLVVSTRSKNISQNRNLPQIGVRIKNI